MALSGQQNTSNTSGTSTPTSLQANILLYLVATIILGTIVGAVLKGLDKLPGNILAIGASLGGVITFISLVLGLVFEKPTPAHVLGKAHIIPVLLASLLTVSSLTWIVWMLPPLDPYIHKGTLVVNDPLDDNSKGYQWATHADKNFSCGFPGQGYHIIARPEAEGYNICSTQAQATNFKDFVYQVTMITLRGDTTALETDPVGGIVFRYDGIHGSFGYLFFFDIYGHYKVVKFRDGGFNSLTQPGTSYSSSYFHEGLDAANLLAVVVQGSKIDCYVNDMRIFSTVDPDNLLSSGQIGVFGAAQSRASSSTEVVFSDAQVWTL